MGIRDYPVTPVCIFFEALPDIGNNLVFNPVQALRLPFVFALGFGHLLGVGSPEFIKTVKKIFLGIFEGGIGNLFFDQEFFFFSFFLFFLFLSPFILNPFILNIKGVPFGVPFGVRVIKVSV